MPYPTQAADLGVELPELPLDRAFEPRYGECETVSPLLRRVLARNPSPFTFHGTATYIVGHGRVAVIDPGPRDEAHLAALRGALAGETVTHILVTHTHSDHSPAAAPLARLTGAPTCGFGAHGAGRRSEGVAVEAGGDLDFAPDLRLADGAVLAGDGWTLDCLHTPGHTSNHLCFALREERCVFTGDHVMGWSTSVIVPPDGEMAEYLASLARLAARDDERYYPTHGAPVAQPRRLVESLLAHRRARERQIAACLAHGSARVAELVRVIYSEVDARLHPAAAMSVLAHLLHMRAQGQVVDVDGRWVPTGPGPA